jgi:hypothetical protein
MTNYLFVLPNLAEIETRVGAPRSMQPLRLFGISPAKAQGGRNRSSSKGQGGLKRRQISWPHFYKPEELVHWYSSLSDKDRRMALEVLVTRFTTQGFSAGRDVDYGGLDQPFWFSGLGSSVFFPFQTMAFLVAQVLLKDCSVRLD